MRLIDADALHEALMTKQKWVVRCGDKHNEGYTYDQVHFAIDEAPTIEAVSIDDYRSMENTCYKLQKALYDMADRKTEPTISKMEQVEDEPQTPYDNCQSCLHWVYDGYWYCECNECRYEPKDEPQTDTEIAKAIVHKMIDDAVIAEDTYPDLRQKMHDAVDEYEPQTDCAWR